MLDRMAVGELPAKHHVALRGPKQELRYEECITRRGFDGAYSIVYHLHRPQAMLASSPPVAAAPQAAPPRALAKRHFRSQELAAAPGAPLQSQVPLLFNEDIVLGVVRPSTEDDAYFSNGDADELYFIFEGGGVLRSPFGDLRFERYDYLMIPKGVWHRFIPDDEAQHWLRLECRGGLSLLSKWRNDTGQLRMDAPYCHRDFRRPEFRGPIDEGIRRLVVKRNGALHSFHQEHSPLDLVGWDGTVYPWAFPILNFQPRVSSVHLPPDWHGTFATRGALICSFVPRLLDFAPDAIPCPYPHSSVDCDELLFYVEGNFTSRKGVGPGSISFHPAGIVHGPHPGAYENSLGLERTDELAVMVDTFKPLAVCPEAEAIEDPEYSQSFLED